MNDGQNSDKLKFLTDQVPLQEIRPPILKLGFSRFKVEIFKVFWLLLKVLFLGQFLLKITGRSLKSAQNGQKHEIWSKNKGFWVKIRQFPSNKGVKSL